VVAGMAEVSATKVVVVKAKPGVEETQAARPEVLSKTPLRQRRAKRKGPVGLSMEKVEEAQLPNCIPSTGSIGGLPARSNQVEASGAEYLGGRVTPCPGCHSGGGPWMLRFSDRLSELRLTPQPNCNTVSLDLPRCNWPN
jgi:hypothetical protein